MRVLDLQCCRWSNVSRKKKTGESRSVTLVSLWWIFWVFTLCGVLVTGLLVVRQVQERQQIYHRILELRTEQDEALSEFTRLQIERGSESSYERVVNVASSELAMKFPNKVITVDPDE